LSCPYSALFLGLYAGMERAEKIRFTPLTTGLLLISSVLFVPGLTLPAVETRHLGLWGDEHSILGLALTLAAEGDWLLAATVSVFSIGFPLTKLVWMWRLQVFSPARPDRTQAPRHDRSLNWLERLGKWSMADVLVIALVVFSLRGNLVVEARPLIGAGCFALSTLMAMWTAGRIVSERRR